MSAPPNPRALLAAGRLRIGLNAAAMAAPLALIAATLGWKAVGPLGLVAAGLAVGLLVVLVAWRLSLKLDIRRLAARLDASAPELEDSAELLFQNADALQGLPLLQRRRVEARIAQGLPVHFKPPWAVRPIALSWAIGLAAAALLAFLPQAPPAQSGLGSTQAGPPPSVQAVRLRIVPPAYTGLRPRTQTEADAKVAAGARLEWSIRFSAQPNAAQLVFADGVQTPLRRDGERWVALRVLEQPTLYRIEAAGAPLPAWRRLDVIADAPPTVAVLAPAERLSIAAPDQKQWTPVFEARDDYGLDAAATLRITVAGGEGEQVAVARRETTLRGTGDGRRRRWAVPLDLAREGLAPGGDLIVQLVVRDNRRPAPQVVEGPSVILRQPSEAALSDGLDGMLVRTMPAFFRSQRQIILDAEALLRARRSLSDETFSARSNALGADQAALRLRYGQFLGEEAESGPAPPTSDAPTTPTLPTADTPSPKAPAEQASEHFQGDGHDHGEAAGDLRTALDAARQFGHVHDDGDAATLFDPTTRSTLAEALDAMWGSERELRQARPDSALPYARRALEALKKAQQASRIYLQKVGPRLPPIDLSRRLSGKRQGIDPARDRISDDAAASQIEAFEAWRALEGLPGAPALRLDVLEAWALENQNQIADGLGLLAAIDAVRRDPACADCRQALRGALWASLEASPRAPRRAGADAAGQRYLDALP